MSVHVFRDPKRLGELSSGDLPGRSYWHRMMRDGTQTYLDNASVQLGALAVGDRFLPLVAAKESAGSEAWITSPSSQFIEYARCEARKHDLPLALSTTARGGLALLGRALRRLGIDRVVYANHWLISTNPWPAEVHERIETVLEVLTKAYPSHAILFPSLDAVTNASMLDRLRRSGCRIIPSRPIYFLDPSDRAFERRRSFCVDRNLLRRASHEISDARDLAPAEWRRLEILYRALYVDKHSAVNPGYTAAYFRAVADDRFVDFRVLRRAGRIEGFIGFHWRDGIMNTPFLGYDTSLPKALGLYRLLATLWLLEGAKRGALIHLSSGAGHFKVRRGGVPALEHVAVFDRHLAPSRRSAFAAIEAAYSTLGRSAFERWAH